LLKPTRDDLARGFPRALDLSPLHAQNCGSNCMEHFWRELRTRSEFGRCVGKEIEGTSDSGARMKFLSVSDFQVSERLANKANPSLFHRGLFSLLFVRAGKCAEVKSKQAEPGREEEKRGARGITVFLRAPPIFHFSGLSPFPAIFAFSPSTEGTSAEEREANSIPRVYSVFKMAAPPAMSFFSILTKFKRVKSFISQ